MRYGGTNKGGTGRPSNLMKQMAEEATLEGGIPFPIGSGVTFQVEASLIMNGFRVADDWIGGPPVLLVMGISWSL